MKTKSYFILAAILLLSFLLITQQACKKEKEKTNQLPKCKITSPANSQEITKGDTITISVEASDSDGNIKKVHFFIDGVDKASATNLPYNYSWNTNSESIGTHSIKTTSVDNDGGSSSDQISVTITETNNNPPIANFTANPTSGAAPLSVNFSDQSTNTPTTWQWDFGNGSTSTQQNPTYTYNSKGTYSVTLTVSNNNGSDTQTKTNYISVNGGATFTDPRDGQTYNIVTIGNQIWFAENLNFIPNKKNNWCYDNDPDNCRFYGQLYSWSTATNVCPSGWHLPTDNEWKTLEMFLGMSQSEANREGWRGTLEGRMLKSMHGWQNAGTGNDAVGFNAKPGGCYYKNNNNDAFYGKASDGYWWTATANGSTDAWNRTLIYKSNCINRRFDSKELGFSVRCVRD